jgi:hypothetical protein
MTAQQGRAEVLIVPCNAALSTLGTTKADIARSSLANSVLEHFSTRRDDASRCASSLLTDQLRLFGQRSECSISHI